MRAKLVAAASAAALALGLAAVWAPAAGRRAQARENQAERAIKQGAIQVDPAELATLMHNRQVALTLFDLRDEAAFNQFHLADAKRLLNVDDARALPDKTVKVLMADDEVTALQGYRQLMRSGTQQVYVLAGGVPAWLALFATGSDGSPALLAGALGGRHPASYPDLEHRTLPKFEAKVKLNAAGGKKGPGGCGG
jgi:rhodanese-related sulfurtransferase